MDAGHHYKHRHNGGQLQQAIENKVDLQQHFNGKSAVAFFFGVMLHGWSEQALRTSNRNRSDTSEEQHCPFAADDLIGKSQHKNVTQNQKIIRSQILQDAAESDRGSCKKVGDKRETHITPGKWQRYFYSHSVVSYICGDGETFCD